MLTLIQLKGLNDCNCHHISDTEKRQYLISKLNSLFSLKRDFMRTSGVKKEKLLIKNDEEYSLVAEEGFEPPTFGL